MQSISLQHIFYFAIIAVSAIAYTRYIIKFNRQDRENQRRNEPKCVLISQDYDGKRYYGTPPIDDRTAAFRKDIIKEADIIFNIGGERVVVYDESGKAIYTIIKGEHWKTTK